MQAQSAREPLVRRARTGSRRGTNLRVEADEPAVGGARRPEARDDQYYQLIIANIRQARIEIAVLNSPEWVKDTLRLTSD